ncbi:Aste57867_25363 [Aphanomyces stellatus]|uniref:Aste57867_25363 protein n=1 Tax=Aphanomyces stellatus TaxID=120398 RepID=A0A485LTL7_9STRA|nr:hypothetical protein As57867_025285 [Aphanomyces stellatus]VFU01988.1 Aste57867_25363 [Aphanomyces stellatus]
MASSSSYAPTLVDYFLEVSLTGPSPRPRRRRRPHRPDTDTEHTPVRTICRRVPTTDRDHFALQDGVRYFCLPDKLNLRRRAAYECVPSFHSFTLTGGDGSRAFGFALTTYRHAPDGVSASAASLTGGLVIVGPSVPHVYCFISHFPFFSLFKHVLGWIYHTQHDTSTSPPPPFAVAHHALRQCIYPTESNQDEDLVDAAGGGDGWSDAIADFVLRGPAPVGGSIVDLRLGSHFAYEYTLLHGALPHVDDVCFQLLFQHLSVKNIVLVLNCLLLEQRVLVHSSQHGLLMPVAEALCALLFPFVWEHVYIPMLPMKLLDYLQAPVPFFMGVHTSYLATKTGAEAFASCVVIHLDKDKVVRPIHSGLPEWPDQLAPVEPHSLPKFPAAPLASLIASVKAILDQYQPTTNPHTAATNRIRTRRKARTSDALVILRHDDADDDPAADSAPHAAPEVELTFGPGPLGITFESTHLRLLATGLLSDPTDDAPPASAVVKAFPQLQNGLPGPAALSGLIAPGSFLLSVNDRSTLPLSFDATCDLLRHEPRPLVLRFQNATALPFHNALQFAARVRASGLLALPPRTTRPTQRLEHVPWVDATREAFCAFFVDLFHDVGRHIVLPATLQQPVVRRHSMQRFVSFDRDGFLKHVRHAAFLKAFLETQTFVVFANDTALTQMPHLGFDSPFVDLFYECVRLCHKTDDVAAALHRRLGRTRPGDGALRLWLHCDGGDDGGHCRGGWPDAAVPPVVHNQANDMAIEINDVVDKAKIIRVESPLKRQSATRHVEMLLCSVVLDTPLDDAPRPPPAPTMMHHHHRRRSLSDSAMVDLELELRRPLEDPSSSSFTSDDPQEDDDDDTERKDMKSTAATTMRKKTLRMSKDKWLAWRRKLTKADAAYD